MVRTWHFHHCSQGSVPSLAHIRLLHTMAKKKKRFNFETSVLSIKTSRDFPGSSVVKDSALSLLWREFNSLARNFHMPGLQPKKKEKRERHTL